MMLTEADVVLLEHAGGGGGGLGLRDAGVGLAGERVGLVVDARKANTDGCEKQRVCVRESVPSMVNKWHGGSLAIVRLNLRTSKSEVTEESVIE